jgi:hypothetical protein
MLQQLSMGLDEIDFNRKRREVRDQLRMEYTQIQRKGLITLPVPGPPQIYKNPGLGNVIPSIAAPVIIDFSRKSLIPCSFDETTDDELDFDNCFILNDGCRTI